MIGRTLVAIVFFTVNFISPAYAGEQFAAMVRKIIDGDSLVVSTGKKTIEVRLYGVDCPEYDQPYSREAKDFAKERVLGKKVLIEQVAKDSYGRTVAIVTQGKKVLNEELVQSGYAWVYPKYCKKDFCTSWKDDEHYARKQKLGLWQETRPISPWQWKKNKRSK